MCSVVHRGLYVQEQQHERAGFAGAQRPSAVDERFDLEAAALERFFGWVQAPKDDDQLRAARRELLG